MMYIKEMKCQRVQEPLGFHIEKPILSWVTVAENCALQTKAQLQVATDRQFQKMVYDSGESTELDSLGVIVPIQLQPRTRYFWRVTVWTETGDAIHSDCSWFETGKIDEPWQAHWITSAEASDHPFMRKQFEIEEEVKSARVYACGLGLYELEVNGEKVGGEYLAPGCTAYDQWIQYQTYDITQLLQRGDNCIGALIGNGWYKGRIGMNGGKKNWFGDQSVFLAEIHIELDNGQSVVFGTNHSWLTHPSYILESGIYDGETQDANLFIKDWSQASPNLENWKQAKEIEMDFSKLHERFSLPVVKKEVIKPVELIVTPAGEKVLDMGQNMVGWMAFKVHVPKGQKVTLQFGEVLQEGNFYQGNLRTAQQKFTYISDGEAAIVRPHFTYYGFRYVKVTGIEEVNLADFEGWVLYSDMEQTGYIETSNPLVNRLFLNALWGQKGNFLDVPTDCPQRDERMGWTGDAQMFAGTASFNMETAAFFRKYLYDLEREQMKNNGAVPSVVPNLDHAEAFSAAWGDAATIIPWQQYVHYGDVTILEQQFDSMKAWVDYIRRCEGGTRLWNTGFHFGDWLSMDSATGAMTGGTEVDLISTAYYAYSTQLVAKAAKVLGLEKVEEEYSQLYDEIREAFLNEFVSPNGRIVSVTQTAQILPLYLGLLPERFEKGAVETLVRLIRKAGNKLQTGFVGTPYICRVLSTHGYNDIAYKLLLNEDLPSWLYPVKQGATTIWERWDSINPDGRISDTGMNSLNHYAYGSVMEWMYRHVLGINPLESEPGFRQFEYKPQPNARMPHVKGAFKSPVGEIESAWSIERSGLRYELTVPFNATAHVTLPDATLEGITINGCPAADFASELAETDNQVSFILHAGKYVMEYQPTVSYFPHYNSTSDVKDLLADPEREQLVKQFIPNLDQKKGIIFGAKLANLRAGTLFAGLTNEQLDHLDEALETYYQQQEKVLQEV